MGLMSMESPAPGEPVARPARVVPRNLSRSDSLNSGPALSAVGTEALPQVTVEALDPASRYLVERSGLGPTDLIVDYVGLTAAALSVALVCSVYHAIGHLSPSPALAFVATFGRLAVVIPLLAAILTSTRRPSLGRPVFSDQVHVLALPLAAGGLVVLAVWQAAFAVLSIYPPALDSVLGMCLLSLTGVAGARVTYHKLRGTQEGRVHRVLIVGSGVVADRVADQMAQSPNVRVVGYVDDDPVDPSLCLGPLRVLSDICAVESVSHVVVAFTRSQPDEIIQALRPLEGRLPITVIPRLFEVLPASAKMHELGSGIAGLNIAPATFGWWPRTVKRTTDVLVAGLAMLVLAPFFIVIALAIRLTSPGPVLFRQIRVGHNGRQFAMLKFRTMHVQQADISPLTPEGESVTGPFPKLKNDPRLTPVGRFLRRKSIDELPQLLNVLLGDMALVGPRPFMLKDAATIDGWALRRYSVRPGITGMWQVSGRNELPFAEMCRLDHLYVNCWSLGLDLRILFRTLWVVISSYGAY